ncbi:YccT family protein [Shewanella woodyi]|uniref:Uncharacterized protein n=1 Tax=Shewanella woodyi (strain ATCC 51908 / MS32) TaxID=392500 RepID=B1KJ66_SHEWM|nr:DUF2057 domain-containing protein [Shewanella woodyi]ACA87086.1 conserved hypothetical protein [Shewanella woodyi ATCC 51908]
MKHPLLTLALTGIIPLIFIAPAFAGNHLTLPKSAELLVVNGAEISKSSQVSLENGTNQIVFKYHTKYRSQGQDKRFSSEAIVLSFTAEDKALTLVLPSLRSSSQSDKFNLNPQVTIEDIQGDALPIQTGVLRKEGIQLGRNYSEEVLNYNQTDAPAALKELAPTSVVISIPPTSPQLELEVLKDKAPELKDQKNISRMLDFWYSQADETTRNSFKEKINRADTETH